MSAFFDGQTAAVFQIIFTPQLDHYRKVVIHAFFYLACHFHDKSHPVFDETRKDYNIGLFAILGYKDPFGWKNFRIDWFNGAFRQNSNIDFFESSSYLSALGIGYTF